MSDVHVVLAVKGSSLEILHGATTVGCSLAEFLTELKAAGLAHPAGGGRRNSR